MQAMGQNQGVGNHPLEGKSLQIRGPGHFSTACTKPSICFVIFQKDHIADRCPKWKEPLEAVQYMGSAKLPIRVWDSSMWMSLRRKIDSNCGQDLITAGYSP
jgi:hypothetical protein